MITITGMFLPTFRRILTNYPAFLCTCIFVDWKATEGNT